jgi:hypothetical protein
MFDDDFKAIEEFLAVGGNQELQTFQKFEKIVDELIKNKFTDNIKDGFMTLNQLIFHSYTQFEANSSDVIKDFAITIIVIRKLLEMLKTVPDGTILPDGDKKTYIKLMTMVVEAMKKETEAQLNFFNAFAQYANEITSTLITDN